MLTVSGAGVNVKQMPAAVGNGTVPLRESFSFDAHYAQCIIEDNAEAFAMPTFAMGTVTIDAHQFFMGMYANDVALVSIKRNAAGLLVAKLTGTLGCATYAGTAETVVGSRTATEPAFYEIEAVDGGEGGGEAGDSFTFTVYFDSAQSPLNYAIFGPNPAFTGTMVSGEITIGPPVLLPLT
ncbi:MAG TPA: hypothetical protein VFD32_04825 [Dehalococcoidia bacterium]|nr:hypothetical protein [Dehalococcoidia bacterium]